MLLLVVLVLSTVAAAGAADSVLSDSARSVVAGEIARSQVGQPSSAAARDARVRSRTAFRGLSPAEARQTLLARHPSLASQPGWLTFPSLSPLADSEPLGPYLLSVDGGDRADSVVLTSQPVAFRDRAGDLRKIDLGLERDGSDDLVTRSSPSDLSLPDALDQGISVGEGGRRFSVLPDVSNGASEAAVEQYAAFYGDVDPDTDFVVKPVFGGVETFSILRSPASPEELRLRLSGGVGSELRSMGGEDGFVLSQGDEDLAAISPPQAWDAQHRPVAVQTSVDGEDLVLRVAHRNSDVAYPIVVDPTVIDTCSFFTSMATGCQVDAWESSTSSTYNAGTAGWAFEGPADGRYAPYAGPGYLGNGLYIRNTALNYFWNGEAADWYYRAPRGVRIFQAQFTNLSQDNLGDNATCLFAGVLGNTGSWETGSPRTYCAQQSLDQTWWWAPTGNPYYTGGGTDGNAAVFGAMASHTGWSSYFMDHMGAIAIGLQEMTYASNNPYISSPDFPDTWQTDSNRYITFHVGDAGLGIRTITFSSPENPTWAPIDADTGITANRDYYACTGGTRLACPKDVWIRLKLGRLREGYSTIRAVVRDVVGKTYTYEHAIGVRGGGANDAFSPQLSLSGPAIDNAGRLESGGWDLEASAVDGSGVSSIAYVIDGATQDVQQLDGCASCAVGAEFTVDTEDLRPGYHAISVTATDRAGNRATVPVTVSVSSTTALDSVNSVQAQTLRDYVEPTACAGAPPFTAYYGGATVAGLPLTYSGSSCDPGEGGAAGSHAVSYGYGSCDDSEGSCGLPLTITSTPLCEAHAKLYRDETGLELPYTSTTLKSVPEASYDGGATVEIYTGNTTIGITSANLATTQAAAAAIRRAPATDVPADGVELTSWPSAVGTTPAATLVQPDTRVLDSREATCA